MDKGVTVLNDYIICLIGTCRTGSATRLAAKDHLSAVEEFCHLCVHGQADLSDTFQVLVIRELTSAYWLVRVDRETSYVARDGIIVEKEN